MFFKKKSQQILFIFHPSSSIRALPPGKATSVCPYKQKYMVHIKGIIILIICGLQCICRSVASELSLPGFKHKMQHSGHRSSFQIWHLGIYHQYLLSFPESFHANYKFLWLDEKLLQGQPQTDKRRKNCDFWSQQYELFFWNLTHIFKKTKHQQCWEWTES